MRQAYSHVHAADLLFATPVPQFNDLAPFRIPRADEDFEPPEDEEDRPLSEEERRARREQKKRLVFSR